MYSHEKVGTLYEVKVARAVRNEPKSADNIKALIIAIFFVLATEDIICRGHCSVASIDG